MIYLLNDFLVLFVLIGGCYFLSKFNLEMFLVCCFICKILIKGDDFDLDSIIDLNFKIYMKDRSWWLMEKKEYLGRVFIINIEN